MECDAAQEQRAESNQLLPGEARQRAQAAERARIECEEARVLYELRKAARAKEWEKRASDGPTAGERQSDDQCERSSGQHQLVMESAAGAWYGSGPVHPEQVSGCPKLCDHGSLGPLGRCAWPCRRPAQLFSQ